MTTIVTVQTGEHAAKVTLTGADGDTNEQRIGSHERNDFTMFTGGLRSVSVEELIDDDPEN